jgi:hypothetical protein
MVFENGGWHRCSERRATGCRAVASFSLNGEQKPLLFPSVHPKGACKMDDRDLHNYEMVLRVNNYGAENATDFPPITFGGQLFADISAAVIKLAGSIAAQSSGKGSVRASTTSKAAAREALLMAMGAIRRTARSISLTTPGLNDKFRIPHSPTDQELLGTARAFATDALPLKSEFLRFALPVDFLDELNTLIAEFEGALNAQQTGKGHRVMAGAAFDDDLDDALLAVRQLDTIVRNTYQDNPAKLAAWVSARHVERAARSTEAAKAPVPPTPRA